MKIQFTNSTNSTVYTNYFCDYADSRIEDLYKRYYQASGMGSVSSKCTGNTILAWYIIVFAILLPIVICCAGAGVGIFFCWKANKLQSMSRQKKAALYDHNTLNSTQNHLANINNTTHMNATGTFNDVDKTGRMNTDISHSNM